MEEAVLALINVVADMVGQGADVRMVRFFNLHYDVFNLSIHIVDMRIKIRDVLLG